MISDDTAGKIVVIIFFIFFLLISIWPVIEERFGQVCGKNDDEDIY